MSNEQAAEDREPRLAVRVVAERSPAHPRRRHSRRRAGRQPRRRLPAARAARLRHARSLSWRRRFEEGVSGSARSSVRLVSICESDRARIRDHAAIRRSHSTLRGSAPLPYQPPPSNGATGSADFFTNTAPPREPSFCTPQAATSARLRSDLLSGVWRGSSPVRDGETAI
jgi:hypothetical protein